MGKWIGIETGEFMGGDVDRGGELWVWDESVWLCVCVHAFQGSLIQVTAFWKF